MKPKHENWIRNKYREDKMYNQINTGDQQIILEVKLEEGIVLKIEKLGNFIYLEILSQQKVLSLRK